MNATSTRPPTLQEIEAAAQVQRHVLQAVDHAAAGNYRKAHAATETAQGAARKLKELFGPAPATGEPRS